MGGVEREKEREREREVVKITNIYIAMGSPKHIDGVIFGNGSMRPLSYKISL